MYNVFTACWGLVALTLLVRLVRDSDSSVQREYADQERARGGRALDPAPLQRPRSDGVGGIQALGQGRPAGPTALLVAAAGALRARETAMYGTVLVLATGWRVAPHEHCKDHVFTICLLPFKQPTPAYDRHQHTLFVTGVLGVDAISAFLYDFRSNQLLVCNTRPTTVSSFTQT